ncbi:hypothetical protein SDC9_165292 [bioreactor metagenome]|uniref:Uncharacterized protein n=1 Tax=bioreactor metagenome TaxID=1076179 RepID=A0A645FTZ4_9ZZZZ
MARRLVEEGAGSFETSGVVCVAQAIDTYLAIARRRMNEARVADINPDV